MKINRQLVLGVAIAALPALGMAGDKSQVTLTQPSAVSGVSPTALVGPLAAGTWTNGVSKGKTQGDDKCKVQIQLGGLVGVPDSDLTPNNGDEVICVSDSNVALSGVPLAVGTVLRGNVKSGKVTIKVDLFAAGTGCVPSKKGGPATQSYEGRTVCYLPDPGYAPVIGFPLPTDPGSGVIVGSFAPRPSTGLIATGGLSFLP